MAESKTPEERIEHLELTVDAIGKSLAALAAEFAKFKRDLLNPPPAGVRY